MLGSNSISAGTQEAVVMVDWHSAVFYPYDLQCQFWRWGVDDEKHYDGED